jgi:ABC-2 type transport system permease protein
MNATASMEPSTRTPAAAEPASPAPAKLPGAWPLLVGQVSYQVRLLTRTPRAILAGVILPILLLVLTSTGSKHSSAVENPLMISTGTFGLISTAYTTHAIALVSARESGVLRRWRATPMPVWCLFAGRVVATVLLALTGVVVTVALGVISYKASVHVGGAIELLLVMALGALAWTAIATGVTGLIQTMDSAAPLLSMTYLPIVVLSGAMFGAISGLPHWLTTFVEYLPAQPIVDAAIRSVSAQHGMAALPVRDIAVLLGWAILGIVVAPLLFRWDPHRPSHHAAAPGEGR